MVSTNTQNNDSEILIMNEEESSGDNAKSDTIELAEPITYLDKFRQLEKDSPYKTELIELLMSVDAHYGHQCSRWNPLMAKYLFAKHGEIHIVDLTKTIFLLKKLLNDIVKIFSEQNARLLFVGSKEQLVDLIKSEAERSGQYYVNHRWFGGTLTNWQTIQRSIKKMDIIEYDLEDSELNLNKKETQTKNRQLNKLENSLGGIRKMAAIPDLIFVTDTYRERVAIAEANKLGIPVIALLDSNSNPKGVDYPIPCNDDGQRSVGIICQLISDAILVGMEICFSRKESARENRNRNRHRDNRVANKETESTQAAPSNNKAPEKRTSFQDRRNRNYIRTGQKAPSDEQTSNRGGDRGERAVHSKEHASKTEHTPKTETNVKKD